MKVVIAGGRDFNDYNLLKSVCDEVLSKYDNIEVVSGGAKGADILGESYALEMGYKVKVFLPDYAKYGTYAPIVRNKLMAEYGDGLILFWNGKSNGSANMLTNARKEKIKIKITKY